MQRETSDITWSCHFVTIIKKLKLSSSCLVRITRRKGNCSTADISDGVFIGFNVKKPTPPLAKKFATGFFCFIGGLPRKRRSVRNVDLSTFVTVLFFWMGHLIF